MTTNPYLLAFGKHATADDGRCAMEWVSYLAGEPHSDQPVCVSPVLRRFCISLNDRLDDEQRQKLRPYLARTIGTAGDGLEDERVRLCKEFLVHHALPVRLDRAGRHEAAARLRALPDTITLEALNDAFYYARDEAFAARREATARLKERILAEMRKRKRADADADADAVAAAAAAAAAAAVADAAAAAVAVADADAAAAAAAAAAAVADAAAAAVADAVAAAVADHSYKAVYRAVRQQFRARAIEIAREMNAEMLPAALDLLDRMLPTEAIQLPVVSEWREIVGVV